MACLAKPTINAFICKEESFDDFEKTRTCGGEDALLNCVAAGIPCRRRFPYLWAPCAAESSFLGEDFTSGTANI